MRLTSRVDANGCFYEAALRVLVGQQAKWHVICGGNVGFGSACLAAQNDFVAGFTSRYGIHTLVWYEACGTMESATAQEKAIKEWKRAWKIRLIEENNPHWRDLYEELVGWTPVFAGVTDSEKRSIQKTLRRKKRNRNLAEVSHHD